MFHMNYRGPINFLHMPIPRDIEVRIVSVLPVKHLRGIQEMACKIPHPVWRPLVRLRAGMRNTDLHHSLLVAMRGQFSCSACKGVPSRVGVAGPHLD